MTRNSFQSFFSKPLAIHQPLLPEIYSWALTAEEPSASREATSLYNDSPADDFVLPSGGVAVIPIHGVITKRGSWWSSRLSTDRLVDIVTQLAARDDIHTIVQDIDSGGGQVAGTARLAQAFFDARSTTKVIACVNEFAASAALWIACAAEHIVIPPTAEIGSLGVYSIHADWSKYLEEVGIKETVIHAGKYKAIHERTLTKELKAHEQGLIDGIYSAFVDDVARFRGVDSEHVLKHWADAQMFLGTDAVSNGLADELGTLSDVLESVAAGRSGRISLPAPESDTESDDEMPLTLNAETGAIMDGDKQLGTLADLNISVEILTKHCAATVKTITDEAVKAAVSEVTVKVTEDTKTGFFAQIDDLAKTFGDAGFSAVLPVVKGEKDAATFRAEQAEAEAASLKAENEKLRKSTAAPGFSASDKPVAGGADNSEAARKAAFEKDNQGFSSFETFCAYEDAKAKGLCD